MTNVIPVREEAATQARPTPKCGGDTFCRLFASLASRAFLLMPLAASAVEFDGADPADSVRRFAPWAAKLMERNQ